LSYRDEEDGTWYIQMLCKAIREEESKEISAILRYTHALISKMVGTNHNKDNEVSMTLTYVESRLSKLFFISRPPQVGNKNIFSIFSDFSIFLMLQFENLKKPKKIRKEIDRERKVKMYAIRRMKHRKKQNERKEKDEEIVALRNKLPRAPLSPQVK
jgi:hypothetical protein